MLNGDKRTGKRTVNERLPVAEVGLPSYTLAEAIDFVPLKYNRFIPRYYSVLMRLLTIDVAGSL